MKFKVYILFLIFCFNNHQVTGSIEIEDVKYLLYTRLNPDIPFEIELGFTDTLKLYLPPGPDRTVKILLHGWVSHGNASWVSPTKNAFFKSNVDYIISVDWSELANDLNYFKVRKLTPNVGEHLAQLIQEMCQKLNIPLINFHLIGHSLGAHISGFAGKRVFGWLGSKLGRITGLDPAGPAFNSAGVDERLSKDDALFVDVMHTNTMMLGYKKQIGHVDFWPNGGAGQNGCKMLDSGCSHNRAPIYFFESIGNDNFPAWACGSQLEFNRGECFGNMKVFMGNGCGVDVKGDFFLNTKAESPFGIPEYKSK